jgi:hypothetical protein
MAVTPPHTTTPNKTPLLNHPPIKTKGVAVSAVGRYLPSLLSGGAGALQLTGPFSRILDNAGVRDPFVRRWMDLLCFLLSGLPADGTIAAEVAFMFNECE